MKKLLASALLLFSCLTFGDNPVLPEFTTIGGDMPVLNLGAEDGDFTIHSMVKSKNGKTQRAIIFFDKQAMQIEYLTYAELELPWSDYMAMTDDERWDVMRADPKTEPFRNNKKVKLVLPTEVTRRDLFNFLRSSKKLFSSKQGLTEFQAKVDTLNSAKLLVKNSEKHLKVIAVLHKMVKDNK